MRVKTKPVNNMTQITTIPKLKEAIKKYKYKLCECRDAAGSKVCASHSMTTKPEKWVDQTLVPFTQRPNNDGVYYVYAYPDTNKKQRADMYTIQVGKNPDTSVTTVQPQVIHHHMSENGERLSLDSYLAVQNELIACKGELAEWKAKYLVLEQQFNDYKDSDDDEDDENGLGENGQRKNFFSDLIPVVDTWLKDKQQERMLEYLKLVAQNPQMGQYAQHFQPGQRGQGMQQPAAQQNSMTQQEIEKAQKFINDLPEDEYKRVEALKPGSASLDDFMKRIHDSEHEIYVRMYNYVNAA